MKQREVVLGVDLGGTNTKIGIVDKDGKVLGSTHFPSRARDRFEDFLEDFDNAYQKLLAEAPTNLDFKGVGLGAPNANYYTGNMEKPANFLWGKNVPLASSIQKLLSIPVVITNDANAAAISEMQFGAAQGMSNFIVLTLGTGLGGGIVVNGDLVLGKDGMAGEIGHTNVKLGGRDCNCGLKGCLETYVSVTGIKRTVCKLLADHKIPSPLRNYSYNKLTGIIVTEEALKGDFIAQQAFEYTGEILGSKLADIVAYFNPEAIILTGGLTKAGDLLLKPTLESMNMRLFPVFRDSVKLMISEVGSEYDAILGAAAFGWKHFG